MRLTSNSIKAYKSKAYSTYEKENLLKRQGFNLQEQNKNNNIRPAQAISFSGSAASMGISNFQKVFHKLVNFVSDNEAAYTAIYSLVFAGLLKPICVLKMPGSEEKDKQIVATKNALQAFIGSFLSLTVGGGLIKKSIDVTKNNLSLIKRKEDGVGFEIANTSNAESMAKKALKKERSGFRYKYNALKLQNKDLSNFELFKEALFKKGIASDVLPKNFDSKKEIFIQLSQKDIKEKSESIIKTAKEHLEIFNKNPDFINSLLTNGTNKEISKQKDILLDLISNNASKEEVKEQYNVFLKEILENSQTGFKTGIKEKAKEVESNLFNKDNINKILDGFINSVEQFKSDETLMNTFDSVWKNSTGWITAIGKAKIASLMLPPVMALLFAGRNIKKASETLTNSPVFNKEKENFKAVCEPKNDDKNDKQVAFKGYSDKAINSLAKGVESLSMSKFGEACVRGLNKLPRPFNKTAARMGDIESGFLTLYWVQNTIRSKKIDPDQKLGLNVHTILVTLVSSTFAFLLDTMLDPLIKKSKDTYQNTIKNSVEQSAKEGNLKALEEGCANILDGKKVIKNLSELLIDNAKEFIDENGEILKNSQLDKEINNLTKTYGKKLSKFKSLTVFTAVVRFLVPVLMVPISGNVKKKIKDKKIEKEKAKAIPVKK